jgi:hypothetical protein
MSVIVARAVVCRSSQCARTRARLLSHLRDAGFPAPKPILYCPVEIVGFVEGEVPVRPQVSRMPQAAMYGLGQLVRRMHNAMASFEQSDADIWSQVLEGCGVATGIRHLDLAPGNVVFRGGIPFAPIDYRDCGTATAEWELGLVVRHWLPLVHPQDWLPGEILLSPSRRFWALLDGYGVDSVSTRHVVEAAVASFDHSVCRLNLAERPAAFAANRRARAYALEVLSGLADP